MYGQSFTPSSEGARIDSELAWRVFVESSPGSEACSVEGVGHGLATSQGSSYLLEASGFYVLAGSDSEDSLEGPLEMERA